MKNTTKLIAQSITEVTEAMNFNEEMMTKLDDVLVLNMVDTGMENYADIEFQGSRVNYIRFDVFGLDKLDEQYKEMTIHFVVARQIKAFFEIESFGYYSKLELLQGDTEKESNEAFESKVSQFAVDMMNNKFGSIAN